MKTKTILFLSMLTIAVGFTACTKDSSDPAAIPTVTVTELDAQADSTINTNFGLVHFGPYTKFSFSEGGIVSDSAENWDIAFRNSKILVNGGVGENADPFQPNRTGEAAAYIIAGEMGDITSVNEALLMQDGDNTSMYGTTAIIDDQGQEGLGWSIYNPGNPQQGVMPELESLAGRILVFRTYDGSHYAKVEIKGFYDAAMTNPYGGFYTFNYVYQSEADVTTF